MAIHGHNNLSSKPRMRFLSLAGLTVLLLQAGCASVEMPRFLASDSDSKVSLTPQQAELKIAFAKAAERRGDFKQALSAYEEIVKMKLGTADVHHRLALIYDRQGDAENAEQNYLQSLRQNPQDAKVLCDYGYSLYLRESWEAAETQYRSAIEAEPQYIRARVNLGMLLARTGRGDEALQQFVLGGLSEGAAHHNLALAALENGDSQTAIGALQLSQQADQGKSASGYHDALAQVVNRMAARR